jgi:hypothetical protein
MKFTPYIYDPDKSLEVYSTTENFLDKNTEIKRRIEELGWIYHTVGMIIPHNSENFWSGHYFPFLDSWEELQVSFTQICFGLYKQAFISLRSGLELGMLSVYFNINDDGHNAVKDWLNSNDNTPRTDKIWKIIRQNDIIKKFDKKHNLEQIHKNLGYLHNYVHTKGSKHSNRMGLIKSNFQTFEEKLLLQWLQSYADIISLISTLHLLKYPISVIRFDYGKKFGIDIPSFGGLEEYNIDKIASILPENYFEDIELIAKEDLATQEMIKEISELPDLSGEQVEDQILYLDKMTIECGEGFTLWLENQKSMLNSLGFAEFDEKMTMRINTLRNWATENGFLDSMEKRIGL